MVTSSGTALIELTLHQAENAESVIRSILDGAVQRIIEIKKTDSPLEKALIRLLELQAAKDDARRQETEAQSAPIKVTKELIESVVGGVVLDDSTAEENTTLEKDKVETKLPTPPEDQNENMYGGSDSTLF